MTPETYYTLLGISETAQQAEIKAAYRELIRQVHPDSLPNASAYWKREAEEKTKEINEAYAVLSNANKRREYDRLLAEARKDLYSQSSPSTTSSVQQSSPPPAATSSPNYSSQSTQTYTHKPISISQGVFSFYGYLIGAVVAFLVLRTLSGALLISIASIVLLYWRKLSVQYRRRCIASFVISIGFFVSDVLYPGTTNNPDSTTVYDGTYSRSCAPGETISSVDHKVCQPHFVTPKSDHPSITSIKKSPLEVHKKLAPVSSTPSTVNETRATNDTGKHSSSEPVPPPAVPSTTQITPNSIQTRNIPAQTDLSSLTPSARQSIESVCSNAKYLQGPAAYDACLTHQLGIWASGPKQPDLSMLSSNERQSIESVCSNAKYLQGPTSYSQCLIHQLQELESSAKHPDLSALTFSERQSIESVCSNAKYLQGPAAYNQCLVNRLHEWANGPKEPDLSLLTSGERQSIQSVCSNAKYLQGPTAYNQCLIRQLVGLGKYHQ